MKIYDYILCSGSGNRFLLFDTLRSDLSGLNIAAFAAEELHRFGVDGLLLLTRDGRGRFGMRMFNTDGSEAEMCGNGIRCVAKYAYDKGLVDRTVFSIHTLAGDLEATVTLEDGEVGTVRINMGAPILDGRKVPVDFDGRFIDQPFEADGVRFRANAVSMGNPHFITFTEMDDGTVDRLGPVLECHPFFPRKTNVEFCRVEDGKIYIRVYERGAAWTLACGTGACASTTAAALNGLVPFGVPVDVHLPGGWLKITVDKDLGYVLMEGPAELVFEGETEAI